MAEIDRGEHAGLVFVGSLLLFIPSSAWSGYVLTQVWSWFIVPLDVPQIDMWHAAGLSVVAAWFAGAYHYKHDERTHVEQFTDTLVRTATTPAIVWGFCAVLHQLMN